MPRRRCAKVIPMGRVYLPATLEAVLEILSREPSARLFAGGTDLLVRSSAVRRNEGSLVCLERVEGLSGVSESDGAVRIGACTTHGELMAGGLIRERFPLLREAVRHIGAPAVRNMGTIGGNICTASPAGDSLPALHILDAEVELHSAKGRRRMPLGRFILGPGLTALEPGEVLTAVWIDKDQGFNFHHFEKVGQRKAMAISVASMAFAARLNGDGIVARARCAFGSVAPKVFTSQVLDAFFAGKPLNEETLGAAAALVREGVSPISDVRASEEYRRTVAGNLLMRLEGAKAAGR